MSNLHYVATGGTLEAAGSSYIWKNANNNTSSLTIVADFNTVQAVPEPGTLGLLGAALGGLGMISRRKKKSAK